MLRKSWRFVKKMFAKKQPKNTGFSGYIATDMWLDELNDARNARYPTELEYRKAYFCEPQPNNKCRKLAHLEFLGGVLPVIDSDGLRSSIQAYADALKESVEELSPFEKRDAILDHVLSGACCHPDTDLLADLGIQIQDDIKDITEMLSLSIDKKGGAK